MYYNLSAISYFKIFIQHYKITIIAFKIGRYEN